MSIMDSLPWPKRKQELDELERLDRAKALDIKSMKLPPDLELRLEDAMEDFGGPKRQPTAKRIADDIAMMERELVGAKQLVADAEARITLRKTQLAERLDMEIADLEALRPKGETNANTDADSSHADPAGDIADGGGAGLPESGTGPQGAPDGAPQIQTSG